jgi:serine protease Do
VAKNDGKYNLEDSEHSEAKLRFVGIAVLIITSLSAGFVGGYFGAQGNYSGSGGSGQQVIEEESELITDIARQVGPSVVSVNVTSRSVEDSLFGPTTEERESAGTGFIIDAREGIIVTNRHVVPRNISDLSITLSDGTELEDVEVLGRTSPSDPLDVAFLKINDKEGQRLRSVTLGKSSDVSVGDKVIAIGNALGQFQNTVTYGIISGYGRSVVAADASGSETLQNLFQTDAAINQGNSGGPLVNFDGEVIGINTAVAGGTAQNIGFAIPIDDAKGLIESVLEDGELQRPYLGVRYISVTDDFAAENDLAVKRGAYIVPSSGGEPSIVPGSPAAKAGVKEGDIIIKVSNTDVDQDNSLTSLIGGKSVGDEVTLTIIRDGEEMTLDVTLADMLDN